MQSDRAAVDWFKRSIDLVTLLILGGGFYFIVDQAFQINRGVGELQKAADLATWNSAFQQWLVLDKFLVENPDVRPYIYSRKAISEDDPNYTKILSYATYVADFIDHVENSYIEENELASSTRSHALEQYFFQIFANSPIVCHVLFTSDQTLYIRTKHLAYHSCGVQAK